MLKNGSSYIKATIFIIGLCAIYLLTLKGGIVPSLLFACLPLIVIATAKFGQKQYYFYAFFIVNFPLKYIFTAYPYNLQVYGITK